MLLVRFDDALLPILLLVPSEVVRMFGKAHEQLLWPLLSRGTLARATPQQTSPLRNE